MTENSRPQIVITNNSDQTIAIEAIKLVHGSGIPPLPIFLIPGATEMFTFTPDSFGVEGVITCAVDAEGGMAVITFTGPINGKNTATTEDTSKVTGVNMNLNASGPFMLNVTFVDLSEA
ncbi:hypothetical protein FRB90_011313 [Tulasnella sp. 427]|nr:hypothetical protein FRB90_011313 [Tulasnella sp. 427]